MQQFTVPQFIDVEAKIIGPITARQFIIMLAGVIVGAISYKFFDFALFITVVIFAFIIIGLFGFTKINGRPFHFFILNFIQTVKRSKSRVWNNGLSVGRVDYGKDETKKEAEFMPPPAKRYTTSRLAELSLIVDTGGAYRGEATGSGIEIKAV
ncbi:MAG: hypothetical protein GWO79_00150 [Actinobacteria bacterium]|nr:hypothetical protein [Actinomycetota bacterium]